MQIDLRKINHAKRQKSFYLLGMGKTLFGQVFVSREWGRLGQPGTVKLDYFETADRAEAHALRIKHQKERRGYVTIAQQQEFNFDRNPTDL